MAGATVLERPVEQQMDQDVAVKIPKQDYIFLLAMLTNRINELDDPRKAVRMQEVYDNLTAGISKGALFDITV